MMPINLNELCLSDFRGAPVPMADNSDEFSGSLRVHFRDLEARAVEFIGAHEYIVACVAWLTNENILRALANKRSVAIVVQKEDFLRPDMGGFSRAKTRRLYSDLRCEWDRAEFDGTPLASASVCGDPGMDPVRCVGNRNNDKRAVAPRMHNKFMVGCALGGGGCDALPVVPLSVWTGSFNMSYSATASLENAVEIRREDVALAYLREWAQIYAISEPLDWESEWAAPTWRIGT
jgi:hypothetical protein